ncbi:CDP-glycerol glycerophosphotransferase family protein [Ancrocorticia populi]|uniref:CDP-glycerol glycerophosphotransferase family protein n=1 Tax=Ancrocorticia populi TaxID=2175228 RepID=UPI003F98C73D
MASSTSVDNKIVKRLVPALRAVGEGFYGPLKRLPLRDRVVIMTRRDITESVDFRTFEGYLDRTHPRVPVVTLYHPMHNKILYIFRIIQQLYYLATSRWIVTDSYQISISMFAPRKGVRVVQIWHSLGAIKQFGRLTVGLDDGASQRVADAMKMHQNYDVVAAPSAATASVFAEAFGVSPSIVKVIGSPRIDYLVTANKPRARRQLVQKYHLDPNRPIYLYAPTFRDHAAVPVDRLVEAVEVTDAQLILQMHSRHTQTVTALPYVVLSREPELLALLPGVDGVITDYSGTTYEAGILEIPLALWAYDEDAYRKSPGFTCDFDAELSDITTKLSSEAIAMLESKRSLGSPQFHQFISKYIETMDDHNCERLAAALGMGE